PLLSMFFPQLSHIYQPLGGEYAIRRSIARQLPFVDGYGVEAGLMIDMANFFGADSIAQVHLPTRVQSTRPLHQLAPMAEEDTEADLCMFMANVFGSDSIAQLHCPPLVHRNRPLHQLAPMAKVVAETIVDRAKLYDADPRVESSAISQRPALEQLGSQEALS